MSQKKTRVALAVFVKTPDISPVKTRLAAETSAEFANSFYTLSCEATLSVLLQAKRTLDLQPFWAVAESQALLDPRWRTLPRIAQGEGALGARMQRVFDLLRSAYGSVMLIGADTPQLSTADIAAAVQHASKQIPHHILGPSADGGFWCVGGNVNIPAAVWLQTPYSSAQTYGLFTEALQRESDAPVIRLKTLCDVDTLADWHSCLTTLKALTEPTLAQLALMQLAETTYA